MTNPTQDQPARSAQDTIPVGGSLRTLMAQDRMHARLVVVAGVFCVLFSAIGLKLTMATIIRPMPPQQQQIAPQVPPIPKSDPKGMIAGDVALPQVHRASIIDRTGQVLAMSLPVAQVYANPQEMIDAADAAHRLKAALPTLNEEETKRRLSLNKQFVYLARDISPAQELAINNLGIPGVYFEPGERRRYPMGRVAAQILGGVDIDDHGVAGVERYFDKRLDSDRAPLRLSVDVRVQNVVHDELQAAMDTFQAIGACAIVMDVHTGEIITMVSLPDYDANDFGRASPDSRFNRAVTGMYEPGSTFKLQTVAMALQERGRPYLGQFFQHAHQDRPLHHIGHEVRPFRAVAVPAGSHGLFLQPGGGAYRAGCGGGAPAGLAARHGLLFPRAGRTARGGAADRTVGP
ncbi:Peptidoglycan glycosyltransferase [Komagataeibacter xylinus E25]|nr:Peptidoglycan glycosyltransferase [Komagataeibacter xylinus E25]